MCADLLYGCEVLDCRCSCFEDLAFEGSAVACYSVALATRVLCRCCHWDCGLVYLECCYALASPNVQIRDMSMPGVFEADMHHAVLSRIPELALASRDQVLQGYFTGSSC